MGELHLEIVAERVRREFGLQVRTGQPQVLMRETLTAEAAGEGTFEREIDEEQVFGHVTVRVGPLPRGEGFRFRMAPEADALPELLAGNVDYVRLDRMNYHDADWVYREHGLQDKMTDDYFRQTGRSLSSAFAGLGIRCE